MTPQRRSHSLTPRRIPRLMLSVVLGLAGFSGRMGPAAQESVGGGRVDETFDAGFGALTDSGPTWRGEVTELAFGPGRTLYVGGAFSSFNGHFSPCVARLHADGTVDTGFAAFGGETGETEPVAVVALGAGDDGSVFVAYRERVPGETHPSASLRFRVAHLGPDGGDTGWELELDRELLARDRRVIVAGLARPPEGRLLVSGLFPLSGGRWVGLARFDADGGLDETFVPVTVPLTAGGFGRIVLDGEGRVLVRVDGVTAEGERTSSLARFLPDGSPDAAFGIATPQALAVDDFVVQPDGKIVIAQGPFTPVWRGRPLVRLNPDGSEDRGFRVDADLGAAVNSLALDAAGGILVAVVDSAVPSRMHRVARLLPDGGTDRLFQFEPEFMGYPSIRRVAVQADGQVLVAGGFDAEVRERSVRNVVRVEGHADRWWIAVSVREGEFRASWWARPGRRYWVEARSARSGASWVPVSSHDGDGAVHEVTEGVAGEVARLFRLRVEASPRVAAGPQSAR